MEVSAQREVHRRHQQAVGASTKAAPATTAGLAAAGIAVEFVPKEVSSDE